MDPLRYKLNKTKDNSGLCVLGNFNLGPPQVSLLINHNADEIFNFIK